MWIALSDDELAKGLDRVLPPEWDRRQVRIAISLLRDRLRRLTDAPELLQFLFVEVVPNASLLVPGKRTREETITALSRSGEVLRRLDPFEELGIAAAIKSAAADCGWSQRDLNAAVRTAITGQKSGLPLYGSIAVLGKDRTLKRLTQSQDELAAELDRQGLRPL